MKNIGFIILGVGRGHFTQATTIYRILQKYMYNIPVVIFIGGNFKEEWNNLFTDSDYYQEFISFSEESITNITITSIMDWIERLIVPLDITKYIQQYNLDMLISFWIPNLVTNFSIPCISIANQYNTKNLGTKLLINLFKDKQIPVSIGEPNEFSPFWVPFLIDNKLIKRKPSSIKICVAYDAAGTDFQKTLSTIATNNPNFEIHFFSRIESNITMPSNVINHTTSKLEFEKYLNKASCVLSTAGDTLVQECVLNGIPIALMPCSKTHIEQVSNMSKYVVRLKYAVKMTPNISLEELSHRDVKIYQKSIQKSIINREEIIINLIKQFEK